jgi:hypothetical protein
MAGYVPNPLAIVALKAASYSLYGWIVAARSEHRRNPIVFGLLRTAAGWIVGLPFLLAISASASAAGWSNWAYMLVMILPRLAIWSLLLSLYFRPKGGTWALVWWTIGGTIVSTATDAVIIFVFDKVDALLIPMC